MNYTTAKNGGKGNMTFWTFLRFFVVLAILATILWIWPGTHVPVVDLLILSVLMAAFDTVAIGIVGRAGSAAAVGFFGWLVSIGILYTIALVLPHVTLQPGAAIAAGTLLWAAGRVFPALFG